MNNKKALIIFLPIFWTCTYAQENNQLQETFIEEFNPQGHAYYQYGMSIADRGKGISEQVASQLDNYTTLINNSDPAKVVQEFESKMAALNNMEGQLDQQQSDLIMNQLDELGDQINANDYQGIQSNLFGSLSALAEMGDAKEQLKKQKKEFEQLKQQRYNQAVQNKYNATRPLIIEFKKRAAFAENKADEQYYLAYVEYLLASITSNHYSPPSKPTEDNSIENKFIAEDVQWANKAKYKFSYYIYDRSIKVFPINSNATSKFVPESFLNASIAFASRAVSINPSSKNYMLLAELYTLKEDFTGYIMYLTAKELDANYVNSYTTQLDEDVHNSVDRVVNELRNSNKSNYNNAEYLNTVETNYKTQLTNIHEDNLTNVEVNTINQIKSVINNETPSFLMLHFDNLNDLFDKEAIKEYNQESLKTFLALNLDKIIKIEGRDILSYAIKEDQEDAVQLILNKYIDGLSQQEKNAKLQKTIMLSVAYNSPKALTRFIKLGVPTDFTLNNYTPTSLAEKLNSDKALAVLQGN